MFCGLAAAPLAGCDEMRRPPERSIMPAVLLTPGPDPVRAAVDVLVPALANQGQGLAGQTQAAVRIVALLEYVTDAMIRDLRFSAVGNSVRVSLNIAREEVRQAAGIRTDATVQPLIQALAGAYRALDIRDRNAAAAALPPSLFTPGRMPTLLRFNRLGPLPASEQAISQLQSEIRRLDEVGGWAGGAGAGGTQLGAGFVGSVLTPGLGQQY